MNARPDPSNSLIANETTFVETELYEAKRAKGKIYVRAIEVTIADEVIFLIESQANSSILSSIIGQA